MKAKFIALAHILKKKEPGDVITLDIKNAFNSLPRNIISDALDMYGVNIRLKRYIM